MYRLGSLHSAVLKSGDWEYRIFGVVSVNENILNSMIAKLLYGIDRPKSILKKDHRSEVSLIDFEGKDYIAKRFVLQRNWWWFKVTSLVFPTTGEVACRNAIGLQQAGLITPQPFVLIQKRRWRMVIDSILIYPFLEGRRATNSDAASIVDFVHRMHSAGWIHRDPHPANFLQTANGTATIDPVRVKRSQCKYMKAYDIMLMEHDMPNAPDLYGREHLGLHFALAKLGHDFVRFYRSVKHSLRRILGLGRSGNLMNSTRRGK